MKKKIEKQKAYRHGDLCLVPVESLSTGIKKSTTDILKKGSHESDHKVVNGDVYLQSSGEYIIGYLDAKDNCYLTHVRHGKGKGRLKKAKLPKGIYELRQQVEIVGEELRPVID